MAEGKKRAAVKARKTNAQAAKGARRRQRTGTGTQHRDAYGSRTVTRTNSQGISITVQIPPLRRPKLPVKASGDKPLTAKRRPQLRPILLVPVLLIAALMGIVGIHDGKKAGKQPTAQAAAEARTEPDFQPLVPSAEKAGAAKYDGTRNLVSYTTSFSGARITVSQQGLPQNFKKDPASLMRAADSINAKQRISTDRGDIFVATNEGGDQMAIFASEQALVFIHVDKKLDDTSWKSFVELLKASSWEELT